MTEFFSVRGRSPLIRLYIRTESGAGGGGGVGGGRRGGGVGGRSFGVHYNWPQSRSKDFSKAMVHSFHLTHL